MGNRAVIATKQRDMGIYLHWSGGRDSVEGFLLYCRLQYFRPPSKDDYGWARLCQVIANFFNAEPYPEHEPVELYRGTSIGVGLYKNLDRDNGDNGVYIIDGWDIVDRLFFHGEEQRDYDLFKMLKAINAAQPVQLRLGVNRLKAGIAKYRPDWKPKKKERNAGDLHHRQVRNLQLPRRGQSRRAWCNASAEALPAVPTGRGRSQKTLRKREVRRARADRAALRRTAWALTFT